MPAKLSSSEIEEKRQKLGRDWQVSENHHLEKTYKFKNFREALAFTNKLGEIAEAEGHHPDIFLAWGQVRVTIFTHSVGGLTALDFELAEKFEQT